MKPDTNPTASNISDEELLEWKLWAEKWIVDTTNDHDRDSDQESFKAK